MGGCPQAEKEAAARRHEYDKPERIVTALEEFVDCLVDPARDHMYSHYREVFVECLREELTGGSES